MVYGSGTILDVNPAAFSDEHLSLEALGHQVLVCPGPGASRRCPLVEDGSCAIVDATDGVVFRLDLDDAYHREMLRCYRQELGEVGPLHVVVRPGQDRLHAALLDGLSVSVGDLGNLGAISSQVSMASAARHALTELADTGQRSTRRAAESI